MAWPEFTRLVAKAASTEPGRQAVLRRLDAMLEPTKQAILAPP